MALPSKNADLYRRLRYYGFGLLLGVLLVSLLYKGKGCEMPGSRKIAELAGQPMWLTAQDSCILKCHNLEMQQLRDIIGNGKVNYDKSEVRAKPYGIYVVESKNPAGDYMEIVLEDQDTVTIFKAFQRMPVTGCDCN